jgi:hypothetical protein
LVERSVAHAAAAIDGQFRSCSILGDRDDRDDRYGDRLVFGIAA